MEIPSKFFLVMDLEVWASRLPFLPFLVYEDTEKLSIESFQLRVLFGKQCKTVIDTVAR